MNRADAVSRWTIIPRPQSGAAWRLLCLPHAGAGASTYFTWGAALLPARIEVRALQYPGRENRLAETRIEDARAMASALADAWSGLAAGTPSVALFGHSMGALLVYELAAELVRREVRPLPQRLFVSGHNAPHLPSHRPHLHTLPERDFLPAVARHYGNIPAELMNDPEIAALISPVLRADFTLVENYRWRETPPLPMPLSVFGGLEDPWTSRAGLAQWSQHTSGGCPLRMLPGDHFFPQKARVDLHAAIVADLIAP